MLPVTALYASLLTIYFIVVSVRVSLARNQTKVSVGDGDNQFLLRRIRVHGNFSEYIPLALILMSLAELAGISNLWLHAAGTFLVLGRIVMIYGLEYEYLPARIGAMACTYMPLLGLAGYLLWGWL